MPKFLSHDGVDSQGVRAEVMVQTGTGRIKELVGKGKPADDGSYRNVEVIFDPDNPKLVRKVYALLDTTAKDLWAYVQNAHKTGADVSFRIESQRKRNIDRTKRFEDLVHTEEVVRVLAAIDTVYSHEAKTNPAEDPSGDNPSALDQAQQGMVMPNPNAPTGPVIDQAAALAALAAARRHELPDGIVDALAAQALLAGASVDAVLAAGFDGNSEAAPAAPVASRAVAVEERPWITRNSDGRINAGSYMVDRAAQAEAFALDHLVAVYSTGKKSNVDVSDEMIAQAASLALKLLQAADRVQADTVGRTDRQKLSHRHALVLVLDAVAKRYHVPVGGNEQAQAEWMEAIVAEATERLYGILEVAQDRQPKPIGERQSVGTKPVAEAGATAVAAEAVEVAEKPAAKASTKAAHAAEQPSGVAAVANAFAATALPAATSTTQFVPVLDAPQIGDAAFIAPDNDLVTRLRDLCVAADVATQMHAVSEWLQHNTNVRSARKIHGPVLQSLVNFYEQAGIQAVRQDVMVYAEAA